MSSYSDDHMVTICHSNSDPDEAPVTMDVTSPVPPAPGSYVTSVTVSSMCLCCTGQQARRCSVNIGESELRYEQCRPRQNLKSLCSGLIV